MKRFTITLAAVAASLLAAAQSHEIFRSQAEVYDTREAAAAGNPASYGCYVAFAPEYDGEAMSMRVYGQTLDVPAAWNDYNVYLHLENVSSAYVVVVNDDVVAEVNDPITPRDFFISPSLRQGENDICVALRESATPMLDAAKPAERPLFAESYIRARYKLGVRDFTLSLPPDSLRRFGQLNLAAVVANDFNYEETLQLGYDIYDPAGKLLDYAVRDIPVAGRSVDTVRFTPYIYHTDANRWGGGRAPLYRVTLYVKRAGMPREYIPLRTGFGVTELSDNAICRFDAPLTLHIGRYNAAADRKTAVRDLKALQAKGIDTVCPDYPQPAWFYDICDELGLYVIDRANIAVADSTDDRRVGGTPSNDPSLLDEYLSRVEAMYYRSRNHVCVIAFALGGEAGNGYNMYKAYQWLKSVESRRPVIYECAAGEWNSDVEL